MTVMITQIIIKLKRLLNERGQGIVEFGLLCAFCAAIGIAARDVGFADVFRDSLDRSSPELLSAAIDQKAAGTYLEYFQKKGWRYMSAAEIHNIEDKLRIDADQKLLIKLAETYLGKTEIGVLNLMNFYSNSYEKDKEPEFIAKLKCVNPDGTPSPDGTGFSDRLYPLEFNARNDTADPTTRWFGFLRNNNQNTINYLTGGLGTIYDKYDQHNPTYNDKTRRTVTTDRVFYSESMYKTNVTVSVKLHYTNGKVDRVAIAARNGGWNGAIGKDLCLMVSETGSSVVKKVGSNDILLETNQNQGKYYADVWNVPDVHD